MSKKRRFGRVRKLPSGRFQARYQDPDGVDRPAPSTFATKTDADRWLNKIEADILSGEWRNPDAGRIALGGYLLTWIDHRPNLRPRTVQLYRWLYKRYLANEFSGVMIADITPSRVRAWRAGLLAEGTSATMAAKAYRLLHAVLNTALDDELIRRNPCRIRGAGETHTPERPVATVVQVLDLAGRVPARFRALILLAAFTGLRYGELAALRRADLSQGLDTVTVRATLTTLNDGSVIFGPPKSTAGRRTVTVPSAIREDIRLHLRDYVADTADALIFTGAKGAVLRRSGFQTQSRWTQSVTEAGLPGFHFHDLRHTGNTLAAGTGASLADLMARMGHGSARAALIYQHAIQQRDTMIADALSLSIDVERDRARNGHDQPSDPS
ncbi:tyrosine-type recombinase/integrase [Actinoplanes sp. URMC 104]|uniref:tyrosine-type recombinase/integrase n=1 Tax=Actinoplanes sp. URMC 104 TaxID=3423409 RepID=UPI003F1E0A33